MVNLSTKGVFFFVGISGRLPAINSKTVRVGICSGLGTPKDAPNYIGIGVSFTTTKID